MKPGEFKQNVIKIALSIPSGKVMTYGQLAVTAGGHPMMSRMITTILSRSPQSDKIPYHRIIYSDGRVWLDPKNPVPRLKLYQQEGIRLDSKNRVINLEKHIHLP